MKTSLNKHTLFIGAVMTAAVALYSCEYDVKELGPAPEASFTVAPVSGQVNKYLLTSTSANAFRFEWDKGEGKGYVAGKEVDTAYFPDKGIYTVKLLTYGQSGIDTVSQTITVAADDPAAMTPLKALTANSSKTWVLAPEAGALVVGPPTGGPWWTSGLADVTDDKRTCLFNDEYTFSKDGRFVFDDKGDFRVDDEGGNAFPTDIGLAIGCYNTSQIPAKYQAWGSGNHTFTVNSTQLKVMGTGAHLGLYKAGETDTTPVPESAITYQIVQLTPDKLVVKKVYGWGYWQFTFRPKS
jgi:PKD repeat protein